MVIALPVSILTFILDVVFHKTAAPALFGNSYPAPGYPQRPLTEIMDLFPFLGFTYVLQLTMLCFMFLRLYPGRGLGKAAWWPLPQYAVPLSEPAEAGALALEVLGAEGRHFAPARADLLLDGNGVQGWQGDDLWALLIAPDGWQQVQLSQVDPDTLWLTEPLARRAPLGSVVLPLRDPIRIAEEWALVDNLSGGRVGVAFASGWHAAPMPG